MGPVRVVHVFGSLNRGGAESVALDLCRSVSAVEFEQHFWLLGNEKGTLATLFAEAGAVISLCPLHPAVIFVPRLWRRLRTLRPDVMVAHSMMVKSPDAELSGEPVELIAMESQQANEMEAYERVLRDAMAGDATLFAREDYVEEAWRIVDPVIKANTPVYEYEPGTWGPAQVDDRILPADGWHNPVVKLTQPLSTEVHAA